MAETPENFCDKGAELDYATCVGMVNNAVIVHDISALAVPTPVWSEPVLLRPISPVYYGEKRPHHQASCTFLAIRRSNRRDFRSRPDTH